MSLRYAIVNGRPCWVNEQGIVVSLANADPGIGRARERDLMSRLPDAELAGMTGPGVVAPPRRVGARTVDDGPRQPTPTFRPLAGASENNRGGSTIVDPADAVFSGPADSDPIRRLVVESPRHNGEDAEAVAVTLGRSVVNQALGTNGDGTSVRALMEWGVGGASFSARVDWGNGGVIVVPASFMRVSVEYRVQGPPFFGNPPIEAFAASLSYGYAGRSKSNAAKFTERVTVAAAGGFEDITIPDFATHVGVIGLPGGGANDALLQFYGATTPTTGNSVFATYTVGTNAASHAEDAFALPEFARTIRVTNNNAVNILRIALIFAISL